MSVECNFCKKSFQKESSLAIHLCEPKRRHREQDERGVQLGLQAYLKFYESMQGTAKLKTFSDFAESSYYRAFVKFGRYCVATRVISPSRFLEWLLKNNKKIDNWCKDSMYEEYLLWYLTVESLEDALTRAIEFSLEWAEKNQAKAEDCLRYGSSNGMVHAIVSGRISAWVIYNSESGQLFLTTLSSEQISIIWPYINTEVWQKKFADYKADQEYVREMLTNLGW